MSDYLYVCLFSNGHIKVGRTTDPQSRAQQHAERVAVVGITLMDHDYFECVGSAVNAEARLIARCDQDATDRRGNEWFEGLTFFHVCKWAATFAASQDAAPAEVNEESPDFRAIVRGLMAAGVRQVDIARSCNCDQSCISDIANGRTKDPRYSIGVALIRLIRDSFFAAAVEANAVHAGA